MTAFVSVLFSRLTFPASLAKQSERPVTETEIRGARIEREEPGEKVASGLKGWLKKRRLREGETLQGTDETNG